MQLLLQHAHHMLVALLSITLKLFHTYIFLQHTINEFFLNIMLMDMHMHHYSNC
jgi:hypothetical protein